MRRVSGPLLDRFDMQVEMAECCPGELLHGPSPEGSATVRERIATARAAALARNGGRPNARLPGKVLLDACQLARARHGDCWQTWLTERHFSARSIHRVMRVARSIADLGQRTTVSDGSSPGRGRAARHGGGRRRAARGLSDGRAA